MGLPRNLVAVNNGLSALDEKALCDPGCGVESLGDGSSVAQMLPRATHAPPRPLPAPRRPAALPPSRSSLTGRRAGYPPPCSTIVPQDGEIHPSLPSRCPRLAAGRCGPALHRRGMAGRQRSSPVRQIQQADAESRQLMQSVSVWQKHSVHC